MIVVRHRNMPLFFFKFGISSWQRSSEMSPLHMLFEQAEKQPELSLDPHGQVCEDKKAAVCFLDVWSELQRRIWLAGERGIWRFPTCVVRCF
jgi:hypothetical protein